MPRKQYRVKVISAKLLADYQGMNKIAAKRLGFIMPKGTDIVVRRGLSKAQRARVVKHEIIEMQEMQAGKSYWAAHRVALRKERA